MKVPKAAIQHFNNKARPESDASAEKSLIIIDSREITLNGKLIKQIPDSTSYLRFEILDKIKVDSDILIIVPKYNPKLSANVIELVDEWVKIKQIAIRVSVLRDTDLLAIFEYETKGRSPDLTVYVGCYSQGQEANVPLITSTIMQGALV